MSAGVIPAGSLPHVGQAQKDPKLHITNTNAVSSKTGAGAPNPLTQPKDIDHTPNLTSTPPLPSAFKSGGGTDSKPGACFIEVVLLYASEAFMHQQKSSATGSASATKPHG